MKVKQYKYNSRQFFSIVDNMDCPVDPYVSAYINCSLISKAPNTTRRYVNELLFAIKYFDDLPSRAESGKFISLQEFSDFYNHCCYQQDTIKDDAVIIFPTVDDKHIRNVLAANQRINKRVQPETIQGRIRALRKYIEWLFKKFHYDNDTNKVALKIYEQLIARIKLNEEDLGRNKNTEVRDFEESLIPDDVYHKLLEMILPSSQNNPFKSSKIRNYLIVSLFIQSGIRRGALAKIKISDCRFHGTYDEIHIYRSGPDPTDTRNNVPNQKTKSHMSVVDKRLMEQIKFYIDHIRNGFDQSILHDFIFVSEKNSKGTAGQPLSLKSINGIFEKLSESLEYRIHPHMLRHKWNEIFDVEAKAKGMDSKLIEDIRKYAMGWSANTTMNQIYNERRLHEQAKEVHQARQERINNQ